MLGKSQLVSVLSHVDAVLREFPPEVNNVNAFVSLLRSRLLEDYRRAQLARAERRVRDATYALTFDHPLQDTLMTRGMTTGRDWDSPADRLELESIS